MKEDKKINKQFLSNTIIQTRKKLGKSQEEFGKLFTPPANKGNISKWEKGKAIPSENRLKTISKLSGMSTNELLYGSLTKSITELINFSFSYDDKKYKEDLKKTLPINETGFLRKANNVNFYLRYDISFYKFPSELKGISWNNSSDKQKREYSKYRDELFNRQFKYYLNEVIKRARAINCNPNNKFLLMDILLTIASNHSNGETYDNKGLINLVQTKLHELINYDIDNLIYAYNLQEKKNIRVSNKISPELEKKIISILYEAEDKIEKL